MTDTEFEAAVMAGPIVDNAGHLTVIGQLEYDGPRCAAGDCDTPTVDDELWCEPCADAPHEFRHDGSRFDFCVCGRIRAIAGYSPVHVDEAGAA